MEADNGVTATVAGSEFRSNTTVVGSGGGLNIAAFVGMAITIASSFFISNIAFGRKL